MPSKSKDKIVIVGAGMAGLTAAAYLTRAGFKVEILEKTGACGGLVNSFMREGFLFDAGARSIENSGIVRPMLTDLGIHLDLLESPVSLGIEQDIIDFTAEDNMVQYENLLHKLFPQSEADIDTIFIHIHKILKDMAILYGIDNPYFRDLKKDKRYIFKELLPWFGKFLFTLRRITKMTTPIEMFLEKLTANQSLIDIIDQHFFKRTPVFFALGYFYVYQDYFYPKGGTMELPASLEQKIREWGGAIHTNCTVREVDPNNQILTDMKGNTYKYDKLIWTADLKTFYRILQTEHLDLQTIEATDHFREKIQSKRGGDSIYTVMMGVNSPPEKFAQISHGHFFYTPSKRGLGELRFTKLQQIVENFSQISKNEILRWLDDYCKYNTYEISIPALRNRSLAPPGKTGIIVSFLFEYELMKKVKEAGWENEFKKVIESRIIRMLNESIYPGIKDLIILQFSSSPLDIADRVGTSEGGITGWSFESELPVPQDLKKMAKAVITPIPNILQAGQWTFAPSGIPIAILTGWHAAQRILKMQRK